MKTLLFTLALVVTAALPMPAAAHPNHDHDQETPQTPITGEQARSQSKAVIAKMAQMKIVPESWLAIEPATSELRTRDGSDEWVTVFKNPAIADTEKRVLYVVFSDVGEYIAANYTDR